MRWRFPAELKLEDAWPFTVYVWRRFDADNGLRMAAGLSYTSLLAIVPLSAIAFAMLAAFPVFGGVRESIQTLIFSNFLPQSAADMRDAFDQFIANANHLTALGIVGLAGTAILLFVTVEQDMNIIFRVAKPRPILPRLLTFWAVMTLGPLLLGVSLSLADYVQGITGGTWTGDEDSFASRLVPSAMAMIGLTLFYLAVPHRPVGWKAALAGGVPAGLLFSGLRDLFAYYVASFPTYQTVYGAVSVVPIFLVWMYLSWTVVLLGAVITASVGEWRAARGRPSERPLAPGQSLSAALGILDALLEASGSGRALTEPRLRARTRYPGQTIERLLPILHHTGYIEQTAEGGWMLARDLAACTLHDLVKALGLDLRLEAGRDDEDRAPWRSRLEAIAADTEAAVGKRMAVPLRDLLHQPAEGGTEDPGGETRSGQRRPPPARDGAAAKAESERIS